MTSTLAMQTLVVQSPDCAYQIIVGRAVVVYPRERTIHRLNEIGSAIWKFLEKGSRVEEVVNFLVENYDVERKTAEQDIREFLQDLLQKKLVVIQN